LQCSYDGIRPFWGNNLTAGFDSAQPARDFALSEVEGCAGIDRAAELIELQLVRWQLGWQDIWVDQARKLQVANQAKVWANRVLEMSGLLSEAITQ
jgi:hypothetical protein